MESRKVCFYFLENRCTYGSRCFYKHEKPEAQVGINCMLIRHGQSGYNLRLQQCVDKHGTDAPTSEIGRDDFQLDQSLVDSGLTQEGVEQAQALKKQAQDSKVEVVFVSPLERALQTAQIIFGEQQVRFLVVPALAEIFSKVCDISHSIEEKRQRYPHMDFSLLEGREKHWQSSFLQQSVKEGLDKCLHSEKVQPQLVDFYLKRIKEWFPDSIELRENCSGRVKECVSFVRKFCKGRFQNVAIVSHRRVLREITSTPSNPKGIGFENCEMVKYAL